MIKTYKTIALSVILHRSETLLKSFIIYTLHKTLLGRSNQGW